MREETEVEREGEEDLPNYFEILESRNLSRWSSTLRLGKACRVQRCSPLYPQPTPQLLSIQAWALGGLVKLLRLLGFDMSRSTPLALGAVSTVSAMIVLAGCYYYYFGENGSADNCLISLGEYEGPVFTGKETISNDKCLVGSKWMQLRQHTLRSPTDGVIDDWLFIDCEW
jgi:hypothetical protein